MKAARPTTRTRQHDAYRHAADVARRKGGPAQVVQAEGGRPAMRRPHAVRDLATTRTVTGAARVRSITVLPWVALVAAVATLSEVVR